jgi:cytochrome P450
MSQSPSRSTYKQMIAEPLIELGKLFPIKGSLVEQATRWRRLSFDQTQGVTLHNAYLIEDFFSGQDVQITATPWGDPAKLGKKSLNLRSYTQRLRATTPALEAIQKHQPSEFFERWLPWTEAALKRIYTNAKESNEPIDLYKALRSASMMIVGRTVCSAFKGEIMSRIEESLEGLDTAYARIAFGGQRGRFKWLPNSDLKLSAQHLKDLESTIRPIIRDRIGGGEQGDDLLTRWIHTKSPSGRSLKEDQVIDEAIAFLSMGYTSLPKVLFGATTNITMGHNDDFLEELSRETSNVIKLITNPPVLEQGTPPPITPHNEVAWKTLPLHNAVVLESLRMYSPFWLAQYKITKGTLPLAHASEETEDEEVPTVNLDEHVWLSPSAFHNHSEHYPQADRFWPQRWTGSLESQLPLHMFSPFGFNGNPSLSEVYCRELAARFLMMWFARYTAVEVPEEISWEMSLCLRPMTPVSWVHKRDYIRP